MKVIIGIDSCAISRQELSAQVNGADRTLRHIAIESYKITSKTLKQYTPVFADSLRFCRLSRCVMHTLLSTMLIQESHMAPQRDGRGKLQQSTDRTLPGHKEHKTHGNHSTRRNHRSHKNDYTHRNDKSHENHYTHRNHKKHENHSIHEKPK